MILGNQLSQVISCTQSHNCLGVMNDKIRFIYANKVWELVEAPKSGRLIDYKWLFKAKKYSKGNVKKFKAMLVANGFNKKRVLIIKRLSLQFLLRIPLG